MRILLSTLLLLSLLLFNNCSSAKWESELSNLNSSSSDQNSSSNNSDRQPQVSSQCQVSQSSASSMTYGQSLYLNAQYSADLSQPQYDCQNASNWQNLVLVSGVSSYSITGLPVGNHTCRIRYLNLNHQWVYCSGVLGVSVIASQMLPSQPTPNPAPVLNPNPNPVASPIGGKGLYRTDENLPDAISTFTALRASQNYLSNYHVVAETGMSGLRFPSSAWNVMGPSDTIRLAVLVPPGVSLNRVSGAAIGS